MKEGSTRRDFLKGTLAAATTITMSPIALLSFKTATMSTTPSLFERTNIKSLEMQNRMMRSSTWSGVGDDRGYVSAPAFRVYGELSKGGIGAILTGYQYVMPNGLGAPYQIGNYEDGQVPGLKELVNTVHRNGGKIVVQLVHCLAKADTKLFFREGEELWGISEIPYYPGDKVPKMMTKLDIINFVEAHERAAARSRECGFDGIQLHGSHGYGINQILSPYWNRRDDAYGGSLRKCYRTVGEIIEAIRGVVGDDYPLMFKISANDFIKGGLTPAESVKIAKWLAHDGIDAIQVSAGCNKDFTCIKQDIKPGIDEAYFLHFAHVVKANVNIPVIAVGGIRSLDICQKILSEGRSDYVSMARPFVREPHIMDRWRNGETKPAKCISCNMCFRAAFEGQGIYCYQEREG
jgi:2,4-dienoyl-CoA reductase-like NADH-dependent reductase (Old Yellow Enzyme family)